MTLRLSGGRRLRSPPGSVARPTAARVRLAVMNILGPRLAGCRWLDLCCGSGAMACEALRRGARQVVAVERDRRVASVAQANLEAVAGETAGGREPGRVRVIRREVLSWLRRKGPEGSRDVSTGPPFDLIYLDPPYRAGLHRAITTAIGSGGWLGPGGRLIWECAREHAPEPPPGWRVRDRRSYGGTELLFLEEEATENSLRDGASAPQGAAAAVLIPGGHEQTHEGDGDQAEHDAAEQGFDHGPQG